MSTDLQSTKQVLCWNHLAIPMPVSRLFWVYRTNVQLNLGEDDPLPQSKNYFFKVKNACGKLGFTLIVFNK